MTTAARFTTASLASSARPMALGTKASTSPAAESTTPVPITLTTMAVPTAVEAPCATRPAT